MAAEIECQCSEILVGVKVHHFPPKRISQFEAMIYFFNLMEMFGCQIFQDEFWAFEDITNAALQLRRGDFKKQRKSFK